MFEAWRGKVEALLVAARAQGQLPGGRDPRRLAGFFLATVEGAFLLTKTQKDIQVMAECFEELRACLGLSASPQLSSRE